MSVETRSDWADVDNRTRPASAERPQRHDDHAERLLLGAMMYHPAVIHEVEARITPDAFYRPAHQTIYRTLVDLAADSQPTDPVALAAKLHANATLTRIGGGNYLHDCLAAWNAGVAGPPTYYARIIGNLATLRRLERGVAQVAQLLERATHDQASEVAELALEVIGGVEIDRADDGLRPWGEILPGLLDHVEAAGKPDPDKPEAPTTGLPDLDDLIDGLAPGRVILVAGRPGMGKALALDTPLPTSTGWTTMGEVQVGDYVIGADGKPTRVVAATEVMHGRPCYEVEFSDGAVVIADAQHQWLTETRAARVSANMAAASWSRVKNRHQCPAVRTTEEIAATLRCRTSDGRLNHSVALSKPFDLPDAELPIDPYTLGVWLGDGHSYGGAVTSADPEIATNIESAGYVVTKHASRYAYGVLGLAAQLRAAGLFRNKHIPTRYLRASEAQRRALLAGLLDTDGSVANGGTSVRFEITSQRLAEDARELIHSLGYRCTMNTRRVPGRTEESSTCYRLMFSPRDKVFRLTRKVSRQNVTAGRAATRRYIRDIRPIDSVPVRCIQVDNVDHLYLAGRACIPTHNSLLTMGFAEAVAMRSGRTAAVFSLEMNTNELGMRVLAGNTRTPLNVIKTGRLSDEDWTRVARFAGETSDAPLFVDDTPDLTMAEIRVRARKLKQQRPDLAMIGIDHIGLIHAARGENRQLQVSAISWGLKLIAKELDVCVVAAAQLNRGPEQRTNKRPQLSDLRESGALEQNADQVILIHRDDYYDSESARAGEADLIVEKNRHGAKDTITVAAQLHLSRFVSMVADM